MVVPMEVMQHVIHVESSYNPFAIGVVGGHLVRQPKNLPEALATVKMLETKGYNFSLGLAQVNRYNLNKYGLDSYEKAFEACPNLQAGSAILAECYKRLGGDWGKSFSCYYSGNSVTGYRHGYVQKVYASMRNSYVISDNEDAAIAVVSKPSRRVVAVSRHPVYANTSSPANMQPMGFQQVMSVPALLRAAPMAVPQTRMQRIIASYKEPIVATVVSEPPTQVQLQQVQMSTQFALEPVAITAPVVVSAIPAAEQAASSQHSAFVF
ncbi:MAG: lytic transglycosylase domain-containing protein [Arenimonas sp.]